MKLNLPRNTVLRILAVLVLMVLVIYFLPFIIGGYAVRYAYKHILNKTWRYGIIAGILLPTFFIGTAWVYGFSEGINNQESLSKAAVSITPSAGQQPKNTLTLYEVERVIDGDTLDVVIDGKVSRIRLIGIDTPESVDPRRPVECLGREASEKLIAMIGGKKVSLEEDNTQGDKDRYGRLLRYVFSEEGLNVNRELILQGYAQEYTYQSNPYKYQQDFRQAEREAREQDKGLWNQGICPTASSTPEPVRDIEPTKVYVIPTVAKYTVPTVALYEPTVAVYNPPAAAAPVAGNGNGSGGGTFVCDCSKPCTQISSCAEAQYLLNNCGCSARDGDGDGIACDGAPLRCQN